MHCHTQPKPDQVAYNEQETMSSFMNHDHDVGAVHEPKTNCHDQNSHTESNKQHDLKISRFDVRTLLDIIPTPRKTPTERALARADVQSNRVFNLLQYERYRGVVEALR